MKIITDENEIRTYFFNEIKGYYENCRLIPFIGSGFTKGCLTGQRNQVPSVAKVKQLMAIGINKVDPEILVSEIETKDMMEVSSLYFNLVDVKTVKLFIKNYFTGVQLNGPQKDFINLKWPWIYTLNIDDAIENCNKYKTVYPYKALNKDRTLLSESVFKLHGDANLEITHANEESIIFSRNQYINSLLRNKAILQYFHEDYISKNMIFIGTSLENEIDLEFILQKNNIKQRNYQVDRIFLTDEVPDKFKQHKLENFGINVVIVVKDYTRFYETILASLSSVKFDPVKGVSVFKNLDFNFLNEKEFNKECITGRREIKILDNSSIDLPIFFCQRDITDTIIKNFEKNTINIIKGRRLSGKTFCALHIARHFRNRDVYFFPSTISLPEQQIKQLETLENAILIFDTNSIDADTIGYIFSLQKNGTLSRNKLFVFIVLNTSDRKSLSVLNYNLEGSFEAYDLSNRFSREETIKINNSLDSIGLYQLQKDFTLIDNIFYLRNQYYEVNFENAIKEKVDQLSHDELKALVLCASLDKIYGSLLSIINISYDEMVTLSNKLDYALELEHDMKDVEIGYHSSYKVILNSKSYIFKLLGTFVIDNDYSLEIMAEIYYDIVSELSTLPDFHQTYKRIIMFDNLNDIIYAYSIHNKSKKAFNTNKLIWFIYQRLEGVLYNKPQYWIQRAKSIWMLDKKNEDRLNEALAFAYKPYLDEFRDETGKKIDASSKRHAQLLIAMIYGRLAYVTNYKQTEYISKSIDFYNAALIIQQDKAAQDVINDARQGREGDNDLREFCKNMREKYLLIEIDQEERKTLNDIIRLVFPDWLF